ncbi:MAG: thioredoxin domain-containing protein [Rhizobiales bacterium]|nr:thioredoxin domain-containing protein [Hyphomicrobiales bacterium]
MLAVTGGLVALTPLGKSGGQTANTATLATGATTSAPAATAEAGAGAASDGTDQPLRLATINDAQKSDIEAVVRRYLLDNPEILLEMQNAFESKMEARREEQMRVVLATQSETLFRSTTAPTLGAVKGDVTVVEFFDYNCGFCKRALDGIGKLIESDKNVRVVFKEFPIFGEDSEAAARAALAAAKQDKYWEMHAALYNKPGRANAAKALQIASEIGLDMARYNADLTSADVTSEIQRVQQLAEAMGIRGTPHFFVGDKVIPGAPEDLFEQLTERVAEVRQSGGCKVC